MIALEAISSQITQGVDIVSDPYVPIQIFFGGREGSVSYLSKVTEKGGFQLGICENKLIYKFSFYSSSLLFSGFNISSLIPNSGVPLFSSDFDEQNVSDIEVSITGEYVDFKFSHEKEDSYFALGNVNIVIGCGSLLGFRVTSDPLYLTNLKRVLPFGGQ